MTRPYRGPVTVKELIWIPALITFAITVLRLVGELAHGPEWLFGRGAGGGFSLVGIVWLVPILGIYFAVKLVRQGRGPSSAARAFLWFPLALVVAFGGFFLPLALGFGQTDTLPPLIVAVTSLISLAVASQGWSYLFKSLLVYAFAARVPVAAVMLLAMIGDWGTHYDVAPEGFPAMNVLVKWFLIGLVPQLTAWIAFTVTVGGFLGGLVGGILAMSGKKPSPAASAR